MSERSEWIDKLKNNYRSRVSYTKAKINVNIASQIKALRRQEGMKQKDLAREAEMLQSRISTIEHPGASGLSVETLVRLASAFRVALVVKFVPFSEMLRWENNYSQDYFKVITLDKDEEFINPKTHDVIQGSSTTAEKTGIVIGIPHVKSFNQLSVKEEYGIDVNSYQIDNMTYANVNA